MSKHLNLRDFQTKLSLRIQESTARPSVNSFLAVQAGNQNWLIGLTDISEVIAPLPWVPVPFTKSWFLGVTNIRGRLYTVVDLSAYAKLGETRTDPNNRLLLTHPHFSTQVALLVDQTLGLRNIDSMQATQSPTASNWAGNCYLDGDNQIWQQIDLASLISRDDFLTISSTH
ncbi:MAG: chemotaxis protein CheW [Betaproteobacteria bacterium]|nr:chemotaxis protein CheW [Betaproteobacteria bacterium]